MRVTLRWQKFPKLTAARSQFSKVSCVYVQADPAGCPIRVGVASKGLDARYRGGDGYAVDAAMHGSQNVVFVAEVPADLCHAVEQELIWQGRRCLAYNNQGKIVAPSPRLAVVHEGAAPDFKEFDPWVEPANVK